MKYLPVLGPDAWVPQSQKMLDGLTAHMYCSNFSQSVLFKNAVTSVAKIIKTNQGRIDDAAREFESRLVQYFSAYFKRVEISIRPITTDDSILNGELGIIGEVEDDNGNVYHIQTALSSKGSIGKKVMEYINDGVLT